MDKGATKEPVTSKPVWDELEEWTRGRIQEWMQQLLVEEVNEFLGRTKVVLAVSSGYRESTASWSALLRDLKARGMNEPRLVDRDGNLGLWSALRNIFPEAQEQR